MLSLFSLKIMLDSVGLGVWARIGPPFLIRPGVFRVPRVWRDAPLGASLVRTPEAIF